MQRRFAVALLAACFILPARAAGDEGEARLRDFLDNVTSFEAAFTQEVVDSRQAVVERSGGTVVMQRPGRFRWDYRDPFERVVVADGERIWLYETDLSQVTVRRLTEGLGDTPAALLTGQQNVLSRFAVRRSWQEENLLWVTLEPKSAEADFRAVSLAFAGSELRRLDLDDRFGQRTRLAFSDVRQNHAVGAGVFRLQVPAGVDVIDESEL
jgi:outer membrane lipoprotein carrier protein